MKIRNAILTCACLVPVCASLSQAQQNQQISAGVIPDAAVTDVNFNLASTPAIAEELPVAEPEGAAEPAGAPVPQGATGQDTTGGTGQDDQWHIAVSPYLWLPWVHGTIGAFGRDVGFSVTPSDLLSHARLAVLGAVDARRNKIVTTVDLLYMRLGASNAIPFPPALNAVSANFTGNIVVLTPKVGLRLVNLKAIEADLLAGIRYWYFGESVNFTPSILGLNFSKSQNWVDPLVGGRIQGALSPKLVATVAGDVGGWGTGSQIDYQVVGLLGYKLKPNMTLQGGYRYLYVDKNKGGPAGATANLAMSGILLGVTVNLK
jgi:hypothetical protein